MRVAQGNIEEINPNDAVEEDDLIQAAWLEVPKVVERFDSTGNAELAPFIGNRIVGAIYDYYRTFNSQMGLPRARYPDIIAAAKQDNPNPLVQKLIDGGFTDATRFISDGELTLRDVSLDAELANNGELPTSLIDFNSPEEQIASSKTYIDLEPLIDQLPDRERYVIASNYGLTNEGTKTLAQIGEVFGLTESRASQLHTSALNHLRQLIAGEEIDVKPQERSSLAGLQNRVSGNALKKAIEILSKLGQTPLYDNDVDNVLKVVPNWSLKDRCYEELDKLTVLARTAGDDNSDELPVSAVRKYLNITAADLEELIKSEIAIQRAESGIHEPSELDPTDIEEKILNAIYSPTQQIADKLNLSRSTVRTHMYNMFVRLGLSSAKQLAKYAAFHDHLNLDEIPQGRTDCLTDAEKNFLKKYHDSTYVEAAEDLSLSASSIRTRWHKILNKTKASTRVQVILLGVKDGIIKYGD